MNKIHPTAIINPNAKLGDNITVGPFCIIGKDVSFGDNCILDSNVVIDGNTTIGSDNHFYHSAVVGTNPQDLKYKGEPTRLVMGNNNTIREFATINCSATMEEPTRVGNNNLIMAYAHIAHNCQFGNNIIMANAVNLAGHVHIFDFAIIGGMTAIAQFLRIGTYAYVGGSSGVTKDIPPYTRGLGLPYKVNGINSVGLKRRGFSSEQINSIRKIFKLFHFSGLNVSQAMEKALEIPDMTNEQKVYIDFVKNSIKGICK